MTHYLFFAALYACLRTWNACFLGGTASLHPSVAMLERTRSGLLTRQYQLPRRLTGQDAYACFFANVIPTWANARIRRLR